MEKKKKKKDVKRSANWKWEDCLIWLQQPIRTLGVSGRERVTKMGIALCLIYCAQRVSVQQGGGTGKSSNGDDLIDNCCCREHWKTNAISRAGQKEEQYEQGGRDAGISAVTLEGGGISALEAAKSRGGGKRVMSPAEKNKRDQEQH